jgi:hypothetical protein
MSVGMLSVFIMMPLKMQRRDSDIRTFSERGIMLCVWSGIGAFLMLLGAAYIITLSAADGTFYTQPVGDRRISYAGILSL